MAPVRTAPVSQPNDEAHQPDVVCPLHHEAVELIGSRWTGAIVTMLLGGPLRFSEIVAAVPGMSQRLCSERLRQLEAEGLVTRRVLTGPPLGVEYTLTAAGRDLRNTMEEIGRWAHRWLEPVPPRTGHGGAHASSRRPARPGNG
jgi:DNA-binding HxlR family transcriptional regulator